jgi:4-amino-4-deoxy-L-arabinose transferase-like glycosyltransferase
MKSLLAVVTLIVFVGVLVVIPVKAEAMGALTVCGLFSIPVVVLLMRSKVEREFLLQAFVAALLVRVIVGTIINFLHLQEFFGGDAITYDFFGFALVKAWAGDRYFQSTVDAFFGEYGQSAWGMVYMVGAIYKVIGRNMLAIQFTNAVFGAATAPVVFSIAHSLFQNRRVARLAALLVAFFPSLVLWSSQGLKDGPIVFLLVLATLLTLQLGEKFSLKNSIILCLILSTLISFRFYLFYMMTAAVLGAFIIGTREFTLSSFIRQLLVVVGIGLALTYMGVLQRAEQQAGYFGDLRVIERGRVDQSRAQSGFGQDVDVSTPEGAIRAVPLGITYLLFAPFPWEVQSLRQSITLPEMLLWWACFPLLVLGLWFTIRHKLRQAFVILVFTTMLTLAYSIFQGNVGTAYRQRAQLLVFYFIFVAVGYVLIRERREEKKQQADSVRQHPEDRPRDRRLPIGAASPAKAN